MHQIRHRLAPHSISYFRCRKARSKCERLSEMSCRLEAWGLNSYSWTIGVYSSWCDCTRDCQKRREQLCSTRRPANFRPPALKADPAGMYETANKKEGEEIV